LMDFNQNQIALIPKVNIAISNLVTLPITAG